MQEDGANDGTASARYDLVELLINKPGDETTARLFEDRKHVVWVDYGDDDVFIVELTESVLGTGKLSAALEADSDYINIGYDTKTDKFPLVMDETAQHITLLRINKMLKPDFELRMVWDSDGGDTLAMIPLSSEQWTELEERYGIDKISRTFLVLAQKPNIFTDPLVRP